MAVELSAPIVKTDVGSLDSGRRPYWDAPLKASILLTTLALIYFSFRSRNLWTAPLSWSRSPLDTPFFVIATIWGVIWNVALAWRVWLWLRYKPMASVSDAELPSVTVILPAYNEGALVRESINSVAASRYPGHKLQVIVIDDGSTDDTWSHISSAMAAQNPDLNIVAFRQPQNRGKRHALFAGFRRATGDVIVTVDSDSILEPDALRNGVTPLVREPKIGAVAGCVEVLNADESIFTRFLKCTFSLSFKFVRAYQSEIRGVFCTPGALSVYRAEVVRKVADEWLEQRFLGQACTTGEDRHMTNLILREGWLTAYQGNARVHAQMPADYMGMCKMLLRWARSNIRETIVLQRFLFKPFRREHALAFRINMTLVLATLILPYLLIGNSWALIFTNADYALRHAGLVGIYALSMAAIYYRNERDNDWIWLLAYEFFWVISLSWIMPYALVTLKNTGWLTRDARGSATAPARGLPVVSPAAAMSPALESGLRVGGLAVREPAPQAA